VTDTAAKYARISEKVDIAAGIAKIEKTFTLTPFNGRLLNVKLSDSEFNRNLYNISCVLTQGSEALQVASDLAGNAVFNVTKFKMGEPAVLVIKDNLI